MTQEQLNELVAGLIIDNATQQVTPAKVRSVFYAVIESMNTGISGATATPPLNYEPFTSVFSMLQASASTNGWLSSTDWTTFNTVKTLQQITTAGATTTHTITVGGVESTGTNHILKIVSNLIDATKYFRFWSKGDNVTVPNTKEVNVQFDPDEGVTMNMVDGSDNAAHRVRSTYVESYGCNYPDAYTTRTDGLGFGIKKLANDFWARLKTDNLTADKDIQLPDGGTIANTAYVDSMVAGLLDDRGSFDASVNTYPSSGGSGTAGAILKGDLWFISVAGTLSGTPVNIGDAIRALVDTPGTTAANWSVLESNLGYVPVNQTRTITIGGVTQDLSADRTFTISSTNVVVLQNRWTLTSADTYYRARADFAGFNADTLTVSTSAANYAALSQTNRSNAAFFYTANGAKKLSKIYFDISNTGSTITGFTLMVVACQRVASTSMNTCTVNGIDLGEYAVSKPSGDVSGFYTITPNDVTIPDGYIVTYFLKRADGSTTEINCSAHFHFIDA